VIIGLTGPAQAGKSTVAEYLVRNYGFKELSFSEDVLDPILKERGIPITKMNRSKLGDELRRKEGMDVLARRLLTKMDYPRIVVSNFRSPEEVEFLKNRTARFYLIRIDADPKIRFSRRGKLDPQTEKEFFARDERDAKNKGMEKVFKMADYTIDNNGPLEKLYEQVDELMDEILGEERELRLAGGEG